MTKDRLIGFATALDAEIAYLRKDGQDRVFELTAGQRDAKSTGSSGVYSFSLADPLRLPDDASGTFRAGEILVPAMVVAHEGNRIWVLLESSVPLPDYFPSGRLELSQTDLLEQLKTRMEELAAGSQLGLAPKVFGDQPAVIDFGNLPAQVAERIGDGTIRGALEQAVGSEVTFLWGPPGTGKTFSIAALVAALVTSGETVLVTSHTHAAVEQALWAAIEPPSNGRSAGLLHGSTFVEDGRILKVGPLRTSKIPQTCHLDGRLELAASQSEADLGRALVDLADIEHRLGVQRQIMAVWTRLEQAEQELQDAQHAHSRTDELLERAQREQAEAVSRLGMAREALSRAQQSFPMGRKSRIQRATAAVAAASSRATDAEGHATKAEVDLREREKAMEAARESAQTAMEATVDLPDAPGVKGEIGRLEAEATELRQRVDELRRFNDNLANELLDQARGLFATLAKIYKDPKLAERTWDTVIIDEASMAMPPLVAWAATRAARRVVVCGDFCQLPPIVNSRDPLVVDELGRDMFHLLGIPECVRQAKPHPQLARLSIQRRMDPAIADVARTLAYGKDLIDHPSVLRKAPAWCDALQPPTASLSANNRHPLVTVDISSIGAWCGKVAGSLSRFNFYSAQVALELAALYASQAPKPATNETRPIGIITPYSAQRRYLSRLLEAMGDLATWVTVGTVHTFQGSECDVIIFDSVLADPHWSARFTDPHATTEVLRDLNVAVTRARHRFVFVTDTAWLTKYAKAGSGYGTLWTHLKAVAPTFDVREVLGKDFRSRVATGSAEALGWGSPVELRNMALLDERDFYPAFLADLERAQKRVVLFTPYIGKRRWPTVEPHVAAAAQRGVEVVLLHKPLTDDAWRKGDPQFGERVFSQLSAAGVTLIPVSGIHAKTITIDDHLVYEGSLNWASQTESYEHMMRIESREVAALVDRMLQLRALVAPFQAHGTDAQCPTCSGPLVVVNQRDQSRSSAKDQPLKLGCLRHQVDKSCPGHLRGVDQRAPFLSPPECPKGSKMGLQYSTSGKPWSWKCQHANCRPIRWRRGDVTSVGAVSSADTDGRAERKTGTAGTPARRTSARPRQAASARSKQIAQALDSEDPPRPSFRTRPRCPRASVMSLRYGPDGKPSSWECNHKACEPIPWRAGDIAPQPAA